MGRAAWAVRVGNPPGPGCCSSAWKSRSSDSLRNFSFGRGGFGGGVGWPESLGRPPTRQGVGLSVSPQLSRVRCRQHYYWLGCPPTNLSWRGAHALPAGVGPSTSAPPRTAVARQSRSSSQGGASPCRAIAWLPPCQPHGSPHWGDAQQCHRVAGEPRSRSEVVPQVLRNAASSSSSFSPSASSPGVARRWRTEYPAHCCFPERG